MLKLNMSELVPLIKEVIDSGASFRLYPHGTSMLPTIREGFDSVELSSPVNPEVFDAVLYRRKNGQYVLHRIVKKHGEYFDMCGDNQIEIEKNVEKFRVISKVTGIYRGEEYISCKSPEHKKEIIKLYKNKRIPRFKSKIKKLIYPAYKFLFRKQ